MENNYKVYKHIFPNGKVYIGITKLKPKYRWGHNGNGYYHHPFLINAIKKYGWDNIKHEVLFENLTQQQAEQKEIELIALNKSNDRQFGYNISRGGFIAGKHSIETRIKISNAKKGRKATEETKHKQSLSLRGIKKDEVWKMKIGLGNQGKVHSKEQNMLQTDMYSKEVLCVETGIKYKNAKVAAISLGHNNRGTNIQNVIDNLNRTAYGFHWRYTC